MKESARSLPVTGAMMTDCGNVREINEDSVRFVLPSGSLAGLAILADGMGGHAAGEVASNLAVNVVAETFFTLAMSAPHRLAASFAAANNAILARARAAPENAGMGTTCTVLAFAPEGVFLAHVGDSRAYVIGADGAIRQVSQDHSLVASLVRAGQLTAEEARRSPDRNVLFTAMGLQEKLEAQMPEAPLDVSLGDRLLLCSDGLSDLVADDEIGATVAQHEPAEACSALIALAKERGGHDNISVGVFLLDEQDVAPAGVDTRLTDLGGMDL